MRKTIFISIVSIIIMLTGCKKISSVADSQPPDPGGPALVTPIGDPVGNPVSKMIGKAGGSLISPDGKMELNFPVGALTANTAISIQPVTNFCPGGTGLAYHLMPDNISFSKPVTLTYHYTPDDVNGNHPYLLYIAYQDSLQTWKADHKNRNVDTIAKTVSLGIRHFSIWSLGANLQFIMNPALDELHENETREIRVVVFSGPPAATSSCVDIDCLPPLPQWTLLPDQAVRRWTLVGSAAGIGGNGTLTAMSGKSQVTYTAPPRIDQTRKVQVSAEIDYPIVFYNNGRLVSSVKRLILFKDITLLAEYNYHIKLIIEDSLITPFYGGLKIGLPVYYDTAEFDLNIQLNGVDVIGTISDSANYPPKVKPPVKEYMGTEFVWLPDPYGVIDITSIGRTTTLPADSIVSFVLRHKNAHLYGAMFKNARDGSVFSNVPPSPFGGGEGLPQTVEIDLKKKVAYIDRTGSFGSWLITEVTPK